MQLVVNCNSPACWAAERQYHHRSLDSAFIVLCTFRVGQTWDSKINTGWSTSSREPSREEGQGLVLAWRARRRGKEAKGRVLASPARAEEHRLRSVPMTRERRGTGEGACPCLATKKTQAKGAWPCLTMWQARRHRPSKGRVLALPRHTA